MTGWNLGQQEPDPYRLLDVDRNASRADVVRAYHLKARLLHPDASRDPDAPARFQELAGAYELLSDPARREAYDRRHPADAPARPRPPGPAVSPATGRPVTGIPVTRHPARAAGPPIWAGPVQVRPLGPAAQAQTWPDIPAFRFSARDTAATLLAELIGRYFGGEPQSPGHDLDWPL